MNLWSSTDRFIQEPSSNRCGWPLRQDNGFISFKHSPFTDVQVASPFCGLSLCISVLLKLMLDPHARVRSDTAPCTRSRGANWRTSACSRPFDASADDMVVYLRMLERAERHRVLRENGSALKATDGPAVTRGVTTVPTGMFAATKLTARGC